MRPIIVASLMVALTLCAWADLEEQKIRAIEIARKSVVSIRAYRDGKSEPGIGSGVILRSDGYILTNHHVISQAKVVKVYLTGGQQFTAQVWKSAPETDLAVLKIAATGLTPARRGNSDAVKLGQTAIAIGDPLGFTGSVTIGTVGGVGRDVEAGGVNYKKLIQTDAAINPGSSGGALVNLDGELIGINALVYNGPNSYRHAQGLGFAIPINEAMEVAKNMVSSKSNNTGKPWLGIVGTNLTAEKSESYDIPAKRGVIVTKVIAGSPADDADLRIGDAITVVDGKTIKNLQDLMGVLAAHQPGERLEFSLWRRGKKMTIGVTLDVQSQ